MTRSTWLALAAALAMGIAAVQLWTAPASRLEGAEPTPAVVDLPTTAPAIRVLLGDRNRAEALVKIDGPYWVTAEAAWKQVLAQGEKLPEVKVSATPDGFQIGGEPFLVRRLKLDAKQTGTLWVAGRRYRGSLILVLRAGGRFSVINELPLEEYLASVISCEMPAGFPVEAQKAQIIAARTFALYQMKTYGRTAEFDVYDSTRSQVYRGMAYRAEDGRLLAAETEHSRRVAADTAGLVLTYKDRLFCGYFSAVCGGHTANGPAVFGLGAPPLVGVACDGCRGAPKYRWQMTFPRGEVQKRLAAHAARSGHVLASLESIEVDDPGRGAPPTVRFTGSGRTDRLSAADFRRNVLESRTPSVFFTLTLDEEQLRVAGRGWGHGVGLCQWGSRGLAEHGMTAAEILAHYFPGSELKVVR